MWTQRKNLGFGFWFGYCYNTNLLLYISNSSSLDDRLADLSRLSHFLCAMALLSFMIGENYQPNKFTLW